MLQRSHAVVSCLGILLALVAAGPAQALEEHQKVVIDRLAAEAGDARSQAATMSRHYAMLLWVEDYCDGRSSQSVRAYLQEKGAGDQDAFDAGWADTVETLTKTEPKAMCALALALYGPQGTTIKGAWDFRAGTAR